MVPALQDGPVTVYHGDALDVLREMPDESVHMVLTSPPYFGLRDYGTASWVGGDEGCNHLSEPVATSSGFNARYFDKPYADGKQGEKRHPYRDTCGKCGAQRVDSQLGLEATPDEYVENMVRLFREVRRVLRSDGTCWVVLGDSFQDKQLVGMPWRVAFALQKAGWILRSDCIWSKSNPMPESVTDRPTTSHEHVFLLTRSPRYFYDADAVREENAERYREPTTWVRHGQAKTADERKDGPWINADGANAARFNGAGRNLRSVWQIATQPYSEAHFATFPEALCMAPIKAGTSERGCCPDCGAPWRRVVERAHFPLPNVMRDDSKGILSGGGTEGANDSGRRKRMGGPFWWKTQEENPPKQIGWEPTCACGNEATVPCTVLDCFAGSGTTLAVARRLGRRAIGIELSASYIDTLIRPRISGAALPLLEFLQEAGG